MTNTDENDSFIFKSGTVTSNKLNDGAVFLLREGPGIEFVYSDLKPSSTAPDTYKMQFDSVKFTYNALQGEQGVTSCLQVQKSVERTYPWLSIKMDSCKFASNSGKRTSAIYFADS